MSTTGTNLVRMGVAGLLALAACLVVWWPTGASGSGGSVILGPIAAASTPAADETPTKTPDPTKTPSASPTAQPSQTANPDPQPSSKPSSKPTKKPSSKPTQKPTQKPNSGGGNNQSGNNGSGNGNNGGNSNNGSGSSNSDDTVRATPTTTVVEDDPVTSDEGAADTGGQKASTKPTPIEPSPSAEPTVAPTADVSEAAPAPETLLTNAEPVETQGAPTWVVPGILLVLTSMLALLGGVLGRGRTTPSHKS